MTNLPDIPGSGQAVTRLDARVTDTHLQKAFIEEARHAMGQPSLKEVVPFIGKRVKLTFNVDVEPVIGLLIHVVDIVQRSPYLVLDDGDRYPLNAIQKIEEAYPNELAHH